MSEEPIASTSTLPPLPTKGGEERQIAIRLTTRDNLYSIPSTKFLVPSSWRRFHLSELINKVLENCKLSLPSPLFCLLHFVLFFSSFFFFEENSRSDAVDYVYFRWRDKMFKKDIRKVFFVLRLSRFLGHCRTTSSLSDLFI